MKQATLMIVLSAALLMAVWGCERKVTNEIYQMSGVPAGAESCMKCHGDSSLVLVAAKAQWENSRHALGDLTVIDRNADPGDQDCERCHTAEGFLAYVTGTTFDGSHFSNIGCFTCHAPHTNGTLQLRVTSAYTLGNGVAFDRGSADLCAACHHSRRNVNTYVSDSVELLTHFGTHPSPQADMLIGTGGYQYAGYEYESSPHANVTPDGCIDCHMSPSIGTVLGGHSVNMAGLVEGEETDNTVGCNIRTCHDGAVADFDFDGVQAGVEALLDTLGNALLEAGLVDADFVPIDGKIVMHKDSTGALYNFTMVENDRSLGIHNTEYAMGLLRSSINYLKYGDPNGGAAAAKRENGPLPAR